MADRQVEGMSDLGLLICDHAAFGLCLVNENHEVLIWNKWLHRHSGQSGEIVCGQDLFHIFPDLAGSRFAASLESCLKSGMASYLSRALNKSPLPLFPVRSESGDPSRLQQEIQITPVALALNRRGALIQVRDATSDFSRERELRQLSENYKTTSIRAEEASISKSQFLASMSHEIRTPLNGVLGMTRLLQETDLNENQLEMIQTILDSGNALMSTLNDVLDMSKIEAGELELEEVDFDLQSVIQSVVAMFRGLASEKQISLETTTNVVGPLFLKGDPVRLRQVIWNLISNAIKFTSEGTVNLTYKTAKGQDPDHCKLAVSVEDTGEGMAQAALSKIFERFHQADKSTTRQHGGTGLGLSLVKHLIDQMGSEITVQSELGQGSAFSFEIQLKKGREPINLNTVCGPCKPEAILKQHSILVAEDNIVNARIAEAYLKKRNHIVTIVETGLDAIHAVRNGEHAIVFMDVHMPMLDGVQATRAIRQLKEEDKSTIPIVGLTADAFVENHRDFVDQGMNEVLTKPINETELDRVLALYLSQRDQLKNLRKSDADLGRNTPDLIDGELLDLLFASLDGETATDILEHARDSLLTELEKLRGASSRQNAAECREQLHLIRGMSGNVGAVRLVTVIRELETAPFSLELLQQGLANLVEIVSETRVALAEYLADKNS